MSYTQHLGVINKCIFDWFFFFLRKYLHRMNFMAFQYSSVWRGALTISRGWIISDLHLWLSRMNHCSRLRIFYKRFKKRILVFHTHPVMQCSKEDRYIIETFRGQVNEMSERNITRIQYSLFLTIITTITTIITITMIIGTMIALKEEKWNV